MQGVVAIKNLTNQGWTLLVWDSPEKRKLVSWFLRAGAQKSLPSWAISSDVNTKQSKGIVEILYT